MNRILLVAAFALASLCSFAHAQPEPPAPTSAAQPAADDAETALVRKSLVKIFSTVRGPDLARPWTKQQPGEASGSGVVIDGRRILTNNHVIEYANRVLVQPDGSSDKLPAKVIAAAPGIDLAILEMDDPTFFDSHPPVQISDDLPGVGATVLAYGYPIGGDAMSVTKGVVSRIEYTTYDTDTIGLRIQVDAALNPGNSGGPALADGKLVGLVFSGIDSAQNIGYLIPVEEIRAFIEDAADGNYEGRPQLFPSLQTLENEALRAKLKLDKAVTGIVITRAEKDSPLKAWDVLSAIGEHAIDNAGMCDVRPGLRLDFLYYVPRLAKDGRVHFTLFREGQKIEVDVPVQSGRNTLLKPLHGTYPPYYIVGPLCFSAATREHSLRLNTMALTARQSPIVGRFTDPPAFEGEQLVIGPLTLLTHKISKGYEVQPFSVLARVNGMAVKNLAHLVELIDSSTDEFIVFEWADEGSESLVFKRQELLDSTEEVLEDNGIRSQMSDGIKGK